jgi:hypothetical protein
MWVEILGATACIGEGNLICQSKDGRMWRVKHTAFVVQSAYLPQKIEKKPMTEVTGQGCLQLAAGVAVLCRVTISIFHGDSRILDSMP